METLITQHKKLSLAIGILLALIVGISNPLKAEGDTEKSKSSISTEDYEFFKEYFQRMETTPSMEQTFVVYNSNGELIHEATVEYNTKIKDEKLQSLLIYSDVIMHFDNISYFVYDDSE